MSSPQDDYVRNLEETIRKFLDPITDVPFPIVIKAISGYDVLRFDKGNKEDLKLLQALKTALTQATRNANRQGIFSNRPNEVGNKIEPFVRDAINAAGLHANIPVTTSGKHKAVGYPDVEISTGNEIVAYLECKTYNIKSEDSELRAFYLQPSEDFKITANAKHLLVGFEIKTGKRRGRNCFIPVGWRLYTLESLKVQVKHEFNASNAEIYDQKSLLASGRI